MKKQTGAMAVFFALSLVLQACAGASTPTEPAAATADSSGELPGAGPETLDLSNSNNFTTIPSSSEISMDFRFESTRADGTPVTGTWRLDGVGQLEPPASRLTFTGTGAANINGNEVFEITTIGEQVYYFTADLGCVNIHIDRATTPFDAILDAGRMLGNEAHRVLPDETINDVAAYQFEITQENLELADPAALDLSEITTGRIYVAQEGGYVVRLALEGRGSSSLLIGDEALEGDIFYQLDFTPVPSVGEITPPNGCAEATEIEFPLLPDASNRASFAGFLSYYTNSDLATVIEFYKAEMAIDGWSLDEERPLANYTTLIFSMADREVSIVVAFDANAGVSNVIIGED